MRRRLAAATSSAVVACAITVALMSTPCGIPDEPAIEPIAGNVQSVPSELAANADADDRMSAANESDEAGAEAQPVAETADDAASYEPGYALAMIEEGATANSVAAAVAEIPALADAMAVDSVDNMVKFALPAGMTVEDATTLIEDAEGVAAAQPNFRYYTLDEEPAAESGTEAGAAAKLAPASAALAPQSVSANDPLKQNQWALSSIKAPAAWNSVAKLGASNKSVGVAVIDSGFLTSHEDLRNVIAKSYNACNGDGNVGAAYPSVLGHGTHVAGIIAAQANNGKGIAGVGYNTSSFSTCKLVPIQVANYFGDIYSDTLLRAYSWLKQNAATYNVRVVNMSLGSNPGDSQASQDTLLGYAINRLWNDGIVTVASAGNSSGKYLGTSYGCWPSDLPNVVSVINLEQAGNADGVARSESSNFNVAGGKAKDISAPGTGISSTYSTSTNSYANMSGTSMAAPAVAGVLALEFKANPNLTAPEAASKLFSSAKDLAKSSGTAPGWDRSTGYGEVNAAAAVSPATPYLSGATMVTKGKKSQLAVKVDNAKQSAKAWRWTSSNSAVATVSATGLVTAKSAGEVIISAKKGGKMARQTLTVTSGPTHVSGLSISVAGRTYTGSALKPAPVVRDGSVTLKKGVHYTLTWSNNTNPDKGTVKVSGIYPYTGSTTKTFTIAPKGTSISKLTGKSKAIAVSWKKQAKQTTGYQVQIATNKAFTANKKTVTKASASAVSATVSGLKAKTSYYARVRTYKVVSGKTYWSAWSGVKSVKTS